jgi:hypothetical protein
MRITRRGILVLLILAVVIGLLDWSTLVYWIYEQTNLALPGQPTL